MNRRWRLVGSVLFALLATVIGAAATGWWWLHRPLMLASNPVELSIEAATKPRDVAQAWVRAGVRTEPTLLYAWFRGSGLARRIRAGSYELMPGDTPIMLLEKMVRGDEASASVRLIDGWTFHQFRAELAKGEALKPVTVGWSDAEIMAAIGAPTNLSPEGRFHPDTYAYSKGSTDLGVLKRAYHAMQSRIDAAWNERAEGTPLRSADDALVLASLIEKETGAAADRGLIAGVFTNRIRRGMPLQTDPSVIYGLGEAFDGNLRRRDLLADTPYNTYTRAGLPPTPIAMPGNASLLAAVRPATTAALYFVSRGDGSSEFSATLAEHNRAVNQFQRSAPRAK